MRLSLVGSEMCIRDSNKVNLPLIRSMLEQVAADASVLHMEKEDLIEDFLIAYQEALNEIEDIYYNVNLHNHANICSDG